jgi:hypothetical protein
VSHGLVVSGKGSGPRTYFGKKGVCQGLVVSGKRACAKDLLFKGEDGAWDLLLREKGCEPRTCCLKDKIGAWDFILWETV